MKVIDMHCDTITELWGKQENGIQVGLRHNDQMIDIERLTKGGYVLQNFAIFVEQQPGVSSFEKAQQIQSVFAREMNQNADRIAMVTSMKGIEENEQAGKLSALLAVEGGEACEGSIEKLHVLYEQGVRMISLVWNLENALGGSCQTGTGLTAQGKEFFRRAQKLGMLVDVSHLSERGFWDMAELAERPIVASHSNSAAVCPHPRNLTDEQFRTICQLGGTAGINLYPPFLTQENGAAVEDVYRHIAHFLQLGGEGHIAIGTDFDGCETLPEGIGGIRDMPWLADALLQRGMDEQTVRKIFGQSLWKVVENI